MSSKFTEPLGNQIQLFNLAQISTAQHINSTRDNIASYTNLQIAKENYNTTDNNSKTFTDQYSNQRMSRYCFRPSTRLLIKWAVTIITEKIC